MKIAFLVGLAVVLSAAVIAVKASSAAEPVDVFITPVPAAPGTSAAILPPGTYRAVKPDGVRLSGWIHSPDISGYAMLKRPQRPAPSRLKMPQRDPQLHFVPVDPSPKGRPNR